VFLLCCCSRGRRSIEDKKRTIRCLLVTERDSSLLNTSQNAPKVNRTSDINLPRWCALFYISSTKSRIKFRIVLSYKMLGFPKVEGSGVLRGQEYLLSYSSAIWKMGLVILVVNDGRSIPRNHNFISAKLLSR
jgi:hypothetical protein